MVVTSAVWRVRSGREAEFEEAWRWHVTVLEELPQPVRDARLWRSASEPGVYLSMGGWEDLDAVDAMRTAPRAPEVVARMTQVCDAIEASVWEPVAPRTR